MIVRVSVVLKRTVHVGDSRRLDTDPERQSSSESKCFCIVSEQRMVLFRATLAWMITLDKQLILLVSNHLLRMRKSYFYFLLTVFRVLTEEEQAEVIADDG